LRLVDRPLTVFYVLWICYVPIVATFLPTISSMEVSTIWGLLYLLLLSFIISLISRSGNSILNTWHLMLILYYAIYFISVSWSPYYSYNWVTIKDLLRDGATPLIVAITGYFVFQKEGATRAYIKHITIAALVMSLISIVQMAIGIPAPGEAFKHAGYAGHLPVEEALRAAGTLGNPNLLAVFLVITIPCILYAIRCKIISEPLGWFILSITLIGVATTVSRKGAATAVLAITIFYGLHRDYKKLLALVVVSCFLGLIIYGGIAVIPKRFEQKTSSIELLSKITMLKAGWNMFEGSPVIGLGYNGYAESWLKYFPDSSANKYDAHNIYITALANSGLLGFIPFVAILLYPVGYCIRTLRRKKYSISKENMSTNMSVICITSLISFMINGFFAGGLFYNFIIMNVLYSNIGMALANIAVDERNS
jgi:putative inorganic carbon (hco3(-)) transporter